MNSNIKLFLVILVIVGLAVSGCQPAYVGEALEEGLTCIVSESGEMGLAEPDSKEISEEPAEEVEEEVSNLPVVVVRESERVSFPSLAKVDADGDPLTYTFSEPLDENGEWLTKVGDEGSYPVTITASDGKVTTQRDLVIVVESLNRAPIIPEIDAVVVDEGETVTLEYEITDPDGNDITIAYSGWMTNSAYETDYQDAGTHYVTISATDGKKTTTRNVKITVKNVNRKPVITALEDIELVEEDLATVSLFASDSDGDVLTYEFGAPLDKNGLWQTKVGDEGTYSVTVSVSDDIDTVTDDVTIKVAKLNHAPVFEVLDKDVLVTVYPDTTATVRIEPVVGDEDNDDVTVIYSGWMDSSEKEVSYEDGGEYEVFVTASDGRDQTTETVTVTVNRAPIIII